MNKDVTIEIEVKRFFRVLSERLWSKPICIPIVLKLLGKKRKQSNRQTESLTSY